jgi:hypothetical protein
MVANTIAYSLEELEPWNRFTPKTNIVDVVKITSHIRRPVFQILPWLKNIFPGFEVEPAISEPGAIGQANNLRDRIIVTAYWGGDLGKFEEVSKLGAKRLIGEKRKLIIDELKERVSRNIYTVEPITQEQLEEHARKRRRGKISIKREDQVIEIPSIQSPRSGTSVSRDFDIVDLTHLQPEPPRLQPDSRIRFPDNFQDSQLHAAILEYLKQPSESGEVWIRRKRYLELGLGMQEVFLFIDSHNYRDTMNVEQSDAFNDLSEAAKEIVRTIFESLSTVYPHAE